jgi:GT2 family glycosyltransferase
VVVDNASQPPVEASLLQLSRASLHVIRSEVNGGPAGGWAIALRHFESTEFTHAWVMDDDIIPEPDCLATLWNAASDDPTTSFVFPLAIQPDGSGSRWGAWCGFLIPREIVAAVGLPMESLFWWAEDAEYCEWRIPQAGFPRRSIDEAVVHHDAIRQGGDIPAWKYYYESRNTLYFHLHIKRQVDFYPRKVTRFLLRALLRQRSHRIACAGAICRGLYDGAFGRLGIRYEVDDPLQERNLSPSAGPA